MVGDGIGSQAHAFVAFLAAGTSKRSGTASGRPLATLVRTDAPRCCGAWTERRRRMCRWYRQLRTVQGVSAWQRHLMHTCKQLSAQ